MKLWVQKHFLGVEVSVIVLVTAASVVVAYRCPRLFSYLPTERSALYSTLASIFGALLGFVIAAIAIVLTLAPDPRLDLVTRSPHYATLWRIFFSATRALGLATVACVAGLVFDRSSIPPLWLVAVVIFSTLWSSLRVWRCIWALEKLVKIIVKRASKS